MNTSVGASESTARIAKCGKRSQIAALGAADARVNVMREIVEGHKVVKMQVWEEPYLARLESVRSEELKHLLRSLPSLRVCARRGEREGACSYYSS